MIALDKYIDWEYQRFKMSLRLLCKPLKNVDLIDNNLLLNVQILGIMVTFKNMILSDSQLMVDLTCRKLHILV